MKNFKNLKEYISTTYVDGASLAVFRILLGLLLCIDTPFILGIAYSSASNTFQEYYYGFQWVQASQTLIWLCSYLLPITAFLMMIGLLYRIAMPLSTIMIAYLFLVCPEYYFNHHYMLWLFIALMSVVPAHQVWSVDALLRRENNNEDSRNVPVWSYWTLKLQTEIIMIYAGLVKINSDWLNLQPLSAWLRYQYPSDIFILKALYSSDIFIAIGAYGVIILHVIGAPLLLWRRTRVYVFTLYLCFHLLNSMTFDIRIFPFMTIGATLLFFAPNWPRRYTDKVTPIWTKCKAYTKRLLALKIWAPTLVTLGFIWFSFQIIKPMVPLLISNNQQTEWSGHNSSFTWRMMLNDNRTFVTFVAHLPERRRIEFVPLEEHLSNKQRMTICTNANKIIQFTQYLKEHYRQKYNTEDVRIHAYIDKSLNFRESELLIDPRTDLTQFEEHYGPHDWIKPSTKPLRSMKEHIKSPYKYPTYREILEAMGLPQEEVISMDRPGAYLDMPAKPPREKPPASKQETD